MGRGRQRIARSAVQPTANFPRRARIHLQGLVSPLANGGGRLRHDSRWDEDWAACGIAHYGSFSAKMTVFFELKRLAGFGREGDKKFEEL
jgi:hypothetical protein